MKMNAVQRNPLQAIGKLAQVAGDKRGGHYHRIAGAEIKRLKGHAIPRLRILLEIVIYRGVDFFAQRLDGGELADIYRSQALGQTHLVAGGKAPLRKVVGKPFLHVVVLFQGLESVLKNGLISTALQDLAELAQRGGAVAADADDMRRGVEIKRRPCPAERARLHCGHCDSSWG